MKNSTPLSHLAVIACLLTTAISASAASAPARDSIDARMLRYPDVSETQLAFVYAGDIWVAHKSGGTAVRLSSPRGEESFPKFSPDGATIAFSGNYDGNLDIYTMPAAGGVPQRITSHGSGDRMLGWYPGGKSLLFASSRTSERDRYNKLFKVGVEGGLPAQLPLPYGEFGAISADGKLLAYTPLTVDFRTWKRYRGGMNPDIWLFDLETKSARNLTQNPANDSLPMWHGRTLFFLSDRDATQRNNLWSLDTRTGTVKQITFFKDYDVQFPSIGPKDIVFSQGDRLWLLDLATLKPHAVDIKVVTDEATLKPRQANVGAFIQSANISPAGKRVVFYARGDIFSVPKEFGVVRNLTRSSGVAERWPTWSPDGKQVAYFSDRSGEYQLCIRPEDGSGEETTLTKLGEGFRYRPQWSPDSKKIAFIDSAMRLWLHDIEAKTTVEVDKMLWLYHDELSRFSVNWSPDSRWFAYPGDLDTGHTAIVIYDAKDAKRHQVTSGFYDDSAPVFDPAGKYLFFRSGRTFKPVYSDLDHTWIYPKTRNLFAVPLRIDVPSPIAPRNDEEGDKEKKDDEKKEDKKDEPASAQRGGVRPSPGAAGENDVAGWNSEGRRYSHVAAPGDGRPPAKVESSDNTNTNASIEATATKKKKDDKPKPVEIDLAGFERRAVQLPVGADDFADLAAVNGKLLYRRTARNDEGEERGSIQFFDFDKREEKTVVADVDGFIIAAKGDALLVRKGKEYSIIEVKENQSLTKKVSTANLETVVDPRAEWRQLFDDTWRIERDFFYDPAMHGVDWAAMRKHYGRLLDQCVTRWDVNFVLGELIAELNSSHTYRSGGDLEKPAEIKVGYLGCDFALTNGAYQIAKILDGGAWDSEVRSPLLRPGITNVKEGDYLLAVNGTPLDTSLDPWAAFQGLADATVMLTVNSQPTRDGATNVLVQTLESEGRLRNLAWIEANRRRVEEASAGRIGYIYVPSTGRDGQSELARQYSGQFTKPGLIVDERFNSGGQIPDRFVELLGRKVENYWGVRHGKDWQWPPNAHNGSMAMLINGWSGSGGDCFPYYFKKAGLGPLIGTRTWGGLIGITGSPGLVDNGGVTAPAFGIYDMHGNWIIEGEGVSPDIEVVDDPAEFAQGRDPQLERAIAEVLKDLRTNPPKEVKRAKHPNRAGKVNEAK
jgi:tricorn protease